MLDLIITLALQTSPVDLEALEFVKRTVAFFEVHILPTAAHNRGWSPWLSLLLVPPASTLADLATGIL